MLLAVTSDWHGDWYTAGLRRYGEVEDAVIESVRVAIDRGCDGYLFTGDLTDPESPESFRVVQLAAECAESLSAEGIDSYWLTGNHDIVEDSLCTHTLLPLYALADGAQSLVEPGKVHVIDRPVYIAVEPEGVSILMLPYVSTARTYDPGEYIESKRELCKGKRVLVAGHLMLEGIGPGSETMDMRRGRDVFFPIEQARTLGASCTMINGHYHEAQEFRGVHIPGSLVRLTKGEVNNRPRMLMVTL